MNILDAPDAITEPGAYQMSAIEYHADPCPEPSLSSSIANLILDASPLHAWTAHPRLNPAWKPAPHSPRLALGTACHALLLGVANHLCIVDADSYLTKAAQMERDDAILQGLVPVLEPQAERAQLIAEKAREQLRQRELAELADGKGDAEVTIAARDAYGTWLRSRLDWWSPDRRVLVDYKTYAGYASPERCATHAAGMGYDVQDAFYQRAVAAAFPELAGRLSFRLVVQEIDEPFALSVIEISEADRHVAQRKVATAIETWNACREANRWPAYPAGVQRVTLPEWHQKRWLDQELEREEQGERPGDWAFAGR